MVLKGFCTLLKQLCFKAEVPHTLTCVGEGQALRGPSLIIFAVLIISSSDEKPEPQMERAYFTEGSRLYREYIFYVLAFNEVERIKRYVFIFFFHHAAFFL